MRSLFSYLLALTFLMGFQALAVTITPEKEIAKLQVKLPDVLVNPNSEVARVFVKVKDHEKKLSIGKVYEFEPGEICLQVRSFFILPETCGIRLNPGMNTVILKEVRLNLKNVYVDFGLTPRITFGSSSGSLKTDSFVNRVFVAAADQIKFEFVSPDILKGKTFSFDLVENQFNDIEVDVKEFRKKLILDYVDSRDLPAAKNNYVRLGLLEPGMPGWDKASKAFHSGMYHGDVRIVGYGKTTTIIRKDEDLKDVFYTFPLSKNELRESSLGIVVNNIPAYLDWQSGDELTFKIQRVNVEDFLDGNGSYRLFQKYPVVNTSSVESKEILMPDRIGSHLHMDSQKRRTNTSIDLPFGFEYTFDFYVKDDTNSEFLADTIGVDLRE